MAPLGKFKKIIFSVLLLLLALFFLEMALRLGGVLFLRLQYPAKPIKVHSDGYNILCLGDSFTQGFGAPQGKSYPEQLQELMKGQTNKNIAVYKEFRINSSTILKNLEKDIHTHHPDLIIIMTGCNDRWNMENATASAFGESDLRGKTDIALSGSRIYKLIKISYLNLRALTNKEESKAVNGENIYRKFETPEAEKHYASGEQFFHSGERELALSEFNMAEGWEPENPWVHWRKACIYIQAMHKTSLGESEIRLAVRYGSSAVTEYVFMLLDQLYDGDSKKIKAMIKEMETIIDVRYNGKEKTKTQKILKRLSLLSDDQKTLEMVVAYNLKEIIKATKKKNIKVLLMNYPIGVAPRVRSVVEKAGALSGTVVIDNFQAFEEQLKTLRREDLFVADGHCNANGYKLIAENLQKALVKERMVG